MGGRSGRRSGTHGEGQAWNSPARGAGQSPGARRRTPMGSKSTATATKGKVRARTKRRAGSAAANMATPMSPPPAPDGLEMPPRPRARSAARVKAGVKMGREAAWPRAARCWPNRPGCRNRATGPAGSDVARELGGGLFQTGDELTVSGRGLARESLHDLDHAGGRHRLAGPEDHQMEVGRHRQGLDRGDTHSGSLDLEEPAISRGRHVGPRARAVLRFLMGGVGGGEQPVPMAIHGNARGGKDRSHAGDGGSSARAQADSSFPRAEVVASDQHRAGREERRLIHRWPRLRGGRLAPLPATTLPGQARTAR